MSPLKTFDEFLRRGIAKRRPPDFARARSLIGGSGKRRDFLEDMSVKMGISDENANFFIEMSYDVLIELIRARLHADGFYCSGEGAHEAEVCYMQNMGFSESETRFMNELRANRNAIMYYGRRFGKAYGEKVLDFVKKIYPKLKAAAEEKIAKK